MKSILAVACLLCLAVPALAHDSEFPYPLLAKERLTIGARIDYEWFAGDFLENQTIQKQWATGVVGSYALTAGDYPLSLVGGTTYSVDAKLFRSWVGVNVRLYSGAADK